MALFFFVVGLEARREFDLGELRERRRIALPVVAALGGMAVPVAIYLAFNAGHSQRSRLGRRHVDRHGASPWACSRSSAPASTQRLRLFILTIAVVDDVVALAGHRRRLHAGTIKLSTLARRSRSSAASS